jgi:hypothetical protein
MDCNTEDEACVVYVCVPTKYVDGLVLDVASGRRNERVLSSCMAWDSLHSDGTSLREAFKQFYREMYMGDGRRTTAQFPVFSPTAHSVRWNVTDASTTGICPLRSETKWTLDRLIPVYTTEKIKRDLT